MWELNCKESWALKNWCFRIVVLEKTLWESLRLQGDATSPSWRRSVLGVHWKDWCWSWNSNTLSTWCGELTHLKGFWCWERLRAGGEGDDRGWDGWMASPTQWAWVWVYSGIWWWTGRPGMLRLMGSQRVGHNWVTELNWTELMGPKAMILVSWMLSFKLTFSLSTFSSSRGSLVHLRFLPYRWCHLHIWGYWYFSWQSWFIQPCISHDVLYIEVKQARCQYTILTYSFPDLESVCCPMSSSNCCFLTCI